MLNEKAVQLLEKVIKDKYQNVSLDSKYYDENEFYYEFYINFSFWLPVLPIKDNSNRYVCDFKIERPIIGVIGKICFFACRGIRYKRNLIDFFCLKKGLVFRFIRRYGVSRYAFFISFAVLLFGIFRYKLHIMFKCIKLYL